MIDNVDILINNQKVVLDEKAAIGSILRNFDLTDPSNRKQQSTNDIQIPVAPNEEIFEFVSSPGYAGTLPYDRLDVQIVVDGFYIIKNGIGFIADVKDGYYIITIREQPDIIQTMKDTQLSTIYSGVSYSIGDTSTWIRSLINATADVKMDFIYNEQTRIYAAANPNYFNMDLFNCNYTGYIKDIFSRAATIMGVTINGSLISDSYFQNIRMVLARAKPNKPSISVAAMVVTDIIPNQEKSFFDLFKAILQVFGAVYTIDDAGTTITIDKLDDLTLGEVDWTDKLKKINSKKFAIEGIGQNNYMRFQRGGEADETLNESVWTCNNKNIAYKENVIEPDIVVHPFLDISKIMSGLSGNENAIYMPDSEFYSIISGTWQLLITNTVNDFIFVTDGADSMNVGLNVRGRYGSVASGLNGGQSTEVMGGGENLVIATYYNSQNDYQRFQAMIENPLVYMAEVDLSVLDLHDYSPYNLIQLDQLGKFYNNRLQYNYDKGGKASSVALIKIED